MDVAELLADGFGRITATVHEAVEGLDVEALVWRPGGDGNSIGWLVWHLTRIADDHVADIAGRDQTWVEEDWATRVGLPSGAMDTGYGHTADQVASIRPEGAGVLLDYHDRVARRAHEYLRTVTADDLDRVVDDSYDPPVIAGVRLVSVLDDGLQHAGQAAYVRGLSERRGRGL